MDFQAMVEEFHAKHGIKKIPRLIREFKPKNFRRDAPVLQTIGEDLHRLSGIAKGLMAYDNALFAQVACRIHLMTEELAEFITSVTDPNLSDFDRELLALDALSDLQYVVSGTAHVADLPLKESFAIVHASNMTKDVKRPGEVRVTGKGANYMPPNLAPLLDKMDENNAE